MSTPIYKCLPGTEIPILIRQGDIGLIAVAKLPAEVEPRTDKPATSLVVGYGEATGHQHTLLNATWVVAPGTTDDELRQFTLGQKIMTPFVVAPDETTIVHVDEAGNPTKDHGQLAVGTGTWEVRRQREYSPQAIRSVVD